MFETQAAADNKRISIFIQGSGLTNPHTSPKVAIGAGAFAHEWEDVGEAIIFDTDPTSDVDWVDYRHPFTIDTNDLEAHEYYRFRFEIEDGTGTEAPWADNTWFPIALYPL